MTAPVIMTSLHNNAAALLHRARRVALVTTQSSSLDCLATMIALARVLEEQSRTVALVLPDGLPREAFVLPVTHAIQPTLVSSRRYAIDIPLADNKALHAIEYERTADGIVVHVETADALTAVPALTAFPAPYDLIVVVGPATLDDLREQYAPHGDIIAHIPLLQITTTLDADRLDGALYSDPNADAVAACSLSIIEYMERQHNVALLNAGTATCLLAGIIDATDCFQHARHPSSFIAAATLIEAGADYHYVVTSHQSASAELGHWELLLRTITLDHQRSLVHAHVAKNGPHDIRALAHDLHQRCSGFANTLLIQSVSTTPPRSRAVLCSNNSTSLNRVARAAHAMPANGCVRVGMDDNPAALQRVVEDLLDD